MCDFSKTGAIPEYWRGYLNEKIGKIKELQNKSASFSFGLITDIHWCENEKLSAALMEAIISECGMRYFFNGGDLISGKGIVNEEELYDEIDGFLRTFAGIEKNCLSVEGNHERAYSTFEPPLYYVQNMKKAVLRERYFKPYTKYDDRKFSKDGSYFYADDENNKIRYIALNSQDVPNDDETEEGFAVFNTLRNYGFLQDQIDWLASEALFVPDPSWSVVVCSHAATPSLESNKDFNYNYDIVLGLLDAFKNKRAYVGEEKHDNPIYDVSVSADFSGKGGDVIAWVGGHRHDDYIKNMLGITIVETTTDASYENSKKLGFKGTTDEHAFDIFTVDKEKRVVNITRIGRGFDREFVY